MGLTDNSVAFQHRNGLPLLTTYPREFVGVHAYSFLSYHGEQSKQVTTIAVTLFSRVRNRIHWPGQILSKPHFFCVNRLPSTRTRRLPLSFSTDKSNIYCLLRSALGDVTQCYATFFRTELRSQQSFFFR
jgi:hypothetical protein